MRGRDSCTVERELGVSPNNLLFGDANCSYRTEMTEFGRILSTVYPRTIQDHVDKLMHRKYRSLQPRVRGVRQTFSETRVDG